ncbi:MAG: UDP-3-O-acyl-N-acetylglucosamine deacetylase [Gemmatimonadota bacterium]|nr:UDP-3-O-acyl-N-acetylglucosamine deacetylase [Gemmatimonadota bacterium]
MREKQRTLAGECRTDGHGLHTGEAATVTLRPAPDDSGIRFRRVDLPGQPEIVATTASVHGVDWETSLRDGEAEVRTVEHILAAVHGSGVDNAVIEVDGPEPPALDGSALGWCELLETVGLETQDTQARVLRVDRPIQIHRGDTSYSVLPNRGYRVSATIDFSHPAIGRQFTSLELDPDSFRAELAGARTFGLAAWEERLRARGLARGASAENTIILGDAGLEEGCSLRYPDEFVRHKVLDIVGDLALVGARLECHVVADRPGHRGNIAVAKKLREELTGEGPALGIETILEYIPHRYPMLLVDRVLEFEEGKRIVGLKNVTINEPFFQGHFPGHPIMPGVLIIEALAQCGGLLLMNEFENPADKVVYFMSLDDVKFRRPVTPGDQLEFELEMLQFRGRRCKMQGTAKVDGRVVAEAKMLARVVDR